MRGKNTRLRIKDVPLSAMVVALFVVEFWFVVGWFSKLRSALVKQARHQAGETRL